MKFPGIPNVTKRRKISHRTSSKKVTKRGSKESLRHQLQNIKNSSQRTSLIKSDVISLCVYDHIRVSKGKTERDSLCKD